VVCVVVDVATAATPLTPTSVALCRKAAVRRFGTAPRTRTKRSGRAMTAEPLGSLRKGMATLGSSWRGSKFGASKTCRLRFE
jgi:hypothetical protein